MEAQLCSTPSSITPLAHIFQECQPAFVSAYTIEGRINCPDTQVEIRRYRWDAPPNAVIQPVVCHLDLALTRRPPTTENSYLAATNCGRTAVGDCVFLPAGHVFSVQSPALDCRILSCMFDMKLLQPYIETEWETFDLSACFNIKNPRIRHGLTLLAEEISMPGFASEILVESMVTTLIVELARHFRGAQEIGEVSGKLSLRQLQLIEDRIENASGPLPTLRELAIEWGLSHRHLIRTFKNTMGCTLSEYITNTRVNQAKRLLTKRGALIKTVAYECGFQSQAAFSAAFRKATGWSPRQFRQITLGLPG